MSNYIIHDGMLCREDELCHFKYIKREKVNGKWVYTYPDTKTDEAEKRVAKVDEAYARTANLIKNQQAMENAKRLQEERAKADAERRAQSGDSRQQSYEVDGVKYNLQKDGTYRSDDGAELKVKQGTNLFTRSRMLSSYTGTGDNKVTTNHGGTLYIGKVEQYAKKYKAKGQAFIDKLFKKKK